LESYDLAEVVFKLEAPKIKYFQLPYQRLLYWWN